MGGYKLAERFTTEYHGVASQSEIATKTGRHKEALRAQHELISESVAKNSLPLLHRVKLPRRQEGTKRH